MSEYSKEDWAEALRRGLEHKTDAPYPRVTAFLEGVQHGRADLAAATRAARMEVWREVLALAASSYVYPRDVDALRVVASGYGQPAGMRAEALANIVDAAQRECNQSESGGEIR